MNRRKRNTRGVTLAELCIVMAVIAIVSTMVVSFTVLMQARTRVIAADRDTVSDLGTVESALDRFIRTYDSDEYTIVQSDPIWASDNPVLYTLDAKYTSISVLKDGKVTAKLKLSTDPDTNKVNAIVITDGSDKVTVTYPLYSVTFVSFAVESNDTSALVTATVEYTSTHGSEQVTNKATICHAVRAMKSGVSADIETVKFAVSEFLKNYGTEGYMLHFMWDRSSIASSNSSSIESAYDEAITAEKDNMCYVLAPKFSGGKIAGLHLYFYKTDTQPESDNPITTIAMYPLCNITKIEYKTPSEGELTRPSSITCIVTYTDAAGKEQTKPVLNWSIPTKSPTEGGIEP